MNDAPITNCIVSGNTAPKDPQVYWFKRGTKPSYSCIQGKFTGEGNINADPQFVAADDYHLSAASPCIDAGKNEDWMGQSVDLDGDPRVVGGKVDMGAYEYGSFHFRITGVIKAEGTQLSWNSRPGDTYTVCSCLDLCGGQWAEQETVVSQGESSTWTDPDALSPCKFYRIQIE